MNKKPDKKKRKAKSSADSPMMRHYIEMKSRNPDSILFYRCGDFYELFFDDAETAARELDLVLTSRDKGAENPVPMAGVPHHASQAYINRMIEKGYKVAVCEQLEDPRQAKGMVKRDVVRIVTPGLVVDQETLEARANNYLVSIFEDTDGKAGIAFCDISTGEFRCTEVEDLEQVASEIVRIMPPELVVPEEWHAGGQVAKVVPGSHSPLVNYRPEHDFDQVLAERLLCSQLKTDNLHGFGISGMNRAIRAAGALLRYVQETQKERVEHLQAISPYFTSDFMVLDETTYRNLELERTIRDGRRKGSLLSVIDRCSTPLGARTLRQWLAYPLLEPEKINERLRVVDEFYTRNAMREGLRDLLKKIGDLQRTVGRISLNRANGRDLSALCSSLEAVAELRLYLEQHTPELLAEFIKRIDPLPQLSDELGHAISDDPPQTVRDGRIFKKGYNSELDELIDLAEHGKDQILAIEVKERERTGIPTAKVRYNRVFGYYIEVSKGRASEVPEDYIRKQTLTNAERFITPELKELEDKVLNATERRNDLEYKLFEELRRKVSSKSQSVNRSSEAIGRLDALANFAEVAVRNDYIKPVVDASDLLQIEQGRHPVVEALQSNERFVPNDCRLDARENQLMIVTGPNMAGKSTVMRQVALIVLLAQIGSFVPAAKAHIGVVDRIFTRVGAADNLTSGLSTFMVEMTETSAILHNATSKSLIILDEIGRGTSTFDGLSIAWAVAERIHDQIGAKTMFATHYHELCELALAKPRVKNYNIAVKEWKDQVVFLRKLVPGATNRSYGIQVGRLAGLPAAVVARAKEILNGLERNELNVLGTSSGNGRQSAGQQQLSLFAAMAPPAESRIDSQLKELQLDTLTPIEALNLIHQWKNEVEADE